MGLSQPACEGYYHRELPGPVLDHDTIDIREGSQSAGLERGGGTRDTFGQGQSGLSFVLDVGAQGGIDGSPGVDLSQEEEGGSYRIQMEGAEGQLDSDDAEGVTL